MTDVPHSEMTEDDRDQFDQRIINQLIKAGAPIPSDVVARIIRRSNRYRDDRQRWKTAAEAAFALLINKS